MTGPRYCTRCMRGTPNTPRVCDSCLALDPHPLQEAIAKAEAIRGRNERHRDESSRCDYFDAAAIIDLLTPLRASDDTRYVAITKQHRDLLANLKSHARVQDVVAAYDALSDPIALGPERAATCADYGHDFEYLQESNLTVCNHCGAAYDAVAPNAKDGA